MRCPPRRRWRLPPSARRPHQLPWERWPAETIALVNPQKNYAQFLLRALLPTIIHVVITLAAGYSVGSEFRRRDARAWLESAGGDPIVALVGKLAPLFCIFFLIMLAEPLFLEGVLANPLQGGPAVDGRRRLATDYCVSVGGSLAAAPDRSTWRPGSDLRASLPLLHSATRASAFPRSA